MPGNDTKKTVLARNKRILTAATLCCVLVVAVFTSVTVWTSREYRTLHVGGFSYHLQIAANNVTRAKGLGGRTALPQNAGMLFVYPVAAQRCFWMQNMRFPLDIIWLSSARKIVYIAANVSPSSYPQQYCPTSSAQYVIELNAGQASRAGLYVGQVVNW